MTDWAALETPRSRVRVGKSIKGGPAERVIQREVVRGLRRLGFRVIHIPNGVKYAGTIADRERQAWAMRMDGLVPGTPDLLVGRPRPRGGPDHGWLEIKRPGGVLSESQVGFRDSALADGFKWAAVCSLDGALDALRGWGWLSDDGARPFGEVARVARGEAA